MRKHTYTICMFKRVMTKKRLLEIFESPSAVAKYFGCRPQAVSQWPDDGLIPENRENQLRLDRPELFEDVA